MTTTSALADSTARGAVVPFPATIEAEARSLICRLRLGDVEAVQPASQLVDALIAASNACGDEEKSDQLDTLAHLVETAIAALESDDPRAIAAKARLVVSWLEMGEPRYAEDLARTLAEGAARLVKRTRAHA